MVTVLELACVPVLGRVHGYTEAFPTGQLIYLFVCTLAVDTMLFFGEFLLMLWMGNPLPALCVGIVGALVGLFSAFMPPLASYFVPFGSVSYTHLKAGDLVHVRLIHPSQKHPGVAGKAFHIAALAVGIDLSLIHI